jgi:reactive intermediate/imine deaminase
MEIMTAPDVPSPKGHYSHAVAVGDLIFVSGILPEALNPGEPDSFERQVRAVFERCQQILQASGSDLSRIVQCTAYISDVALWPEFNAIYASILGSHKPARAVVPVAALHYGFQVEIQVVAQRSGT